MSCEQIAQLLSARLDEALTEQETMQLNEHLERCPACRALEAQLAALHASLDDMEELTPPEGFAEAVMKQIRANEAKKTKVIPLFRRPQIRALAGLAACAVLCVGLYQGGRANMEQAQNVSSAAGQEMELYTAQSPVAAHETDGGAVVYAAVEEAAEKFDQQRAMNESTAAATAAAHYTFANDQYLPVTYGSTPEAPSALVMGTADSLTAFLAQFPADELTYLEETYDSNYFETGRLLAVVLEEGSGSVCHAIDEQGLSRSVVIIQRQVPEAGTCDMAAWLILAEVEAAFEDGEMLEVVFTTTK